MTDRPPSIWEGRLVRLRATEPGDWERFWQDARDTEAARSGWQTTFPRSTEQAKKFVADRSTIDSGDQLSYFWGIETLAGEHVGSCNTHGVDARNAHFEYGISIFREQRGHGYAGDAIYVMLRYYFNELRFNKVNATVYSFNKESLALHRRLGFTEEGCIRQNLFTNGTFHDEFWFGMTAAEFRAKYGP
jgi:RimJ/RimL family protein N-acetyltransferase